MHKSKGDCDMIGCPICNDQPPADRPNETVERVLMAKNGNISIGIRVAFHDKYHAEDMGALAGYRIALTASEPEGWLVFHGEPEANGPWIYFDKKFIAENCEDLGPL